MQNNKVKFPYATSIGHLIKVVERLSRSFPPKFDAGYCESLNIKGSNASAVTGVVKFLGLVDDNGAPAGKNPFGLKGEERRKALENLVREKYALLFNVLGSELAELTKDDLLNFFKSYHRSSKQPSDVSANLMMQAFLTVSSEAGIDVPGFFQKPSPRTMDTATAATQMTSRKKKKRRTPSDSQRKGERKDDVDETVLPSPQVAINLQIALQAGASLEDYKKLLSAMRDVFWPSRGDN